MKILRQIVIGGALLVFASGMASANTVTAITFCGTFNFSDTGGGGGGTSSFTCNLGAILPAGQTPTSEFLVYDSDFSSPITFPISEMTSFTFVGTGLQWNSDTSTAGSSNAMTDNYLSSQGAVFQSATTLNGTNIVAGFYDPFTSNIPPGSSVTVNSTTLGINGSAVQLTGYAELVVTYNASPVAPEPGTIALMGGGMCIVAGVFRRRKLKSKS